jgi:hypothetical protein
LNCVTSPSKSVFSQPPVFPKNSMKRLHWKRILLSKMPAYVGSMDHLLMTQAKERFDDLEVFTQD